MRGIQRDDGLPDAKPFFFGIWASQTVPNVTDTTLPITVVKRSQKGMLLSGGGCKVPIAGLYHLGLTLRSDNNAASTLYTEPHICVNGTRVANSLKDNANISGYKVQYEYHTLWLVWPLKAADVVTVTFYCNGAAANVFSGDAWPNDGLRVMYDSPWTGEP